TEPVLGLDAVRVVRSVEQVFDADRQHEPVVRRRSAQARHRISGHSLPLVRFVTSHVLTQIASHVEGAAEGNRTQRSNAKPTRPRWSGDNGMMSPGFVGCGFGSLVAIWTALW